MVWLSAFLLGCSGSKSSSEAGVLPADVAYPLDAICAAVAGEPGEACGCDGTCAAGGQCIVVALQYPRRLSVSVCRSAAAGVCDCGLTYRDTCQSGFSCLCPVFTSPLDGICLTDEQKAVLCSGPLAESFSCPIDTSRDAMN